MFVSIIGVFRDAHLFHALVNPVPMYQARKRLGMLPEYLGRGAEALGGMLETLSRRIALLPAPRSALPRFYPCIPGEYTHVVDPPHLSATYVLTLSTTEFRYL